MADIIPGFESQFETNSIEDKLQLSQPKGFIGGSENSVNDPPSVDLKSEKCCIGYLELEGTVTRTFFAENDARYSTSKAPWEATIRQKSVTICNEDYNCNSPECENSVNDFNYRVSDQFTDYGGGGRGLVKKWSPTPRDTRKGVYIGPYRFKGGTYSPFSAPDTSYPPGFRGDNSGGTAEYTFKYVRTKKLGCCVSPCDSREKTVTHDLKGEATTIGSDTRSPVGGQGSTMATPVGTIPPETTGFTESPSGYVGEPGMREIGAEIVANLGLESESNPPLFLPCCTRGDS
jgi:hypothetical protein